MFSRVVWKWTHWSLAATLGWGALTVLGCHEEHDRAGTLAEEPATDPSQVGSLRLALVTRATSIYRLRDAVFTIQDGAGLRTVTLRSDDAPDATSLDTELLQGSYLLSLADGWSLERVEESSGSGTPVRAALLTPNPTEFEILNHQERDIVYSFATDEGVITFGRGSLSVSVAVLPAGALGACDPLDASTCAGGQTCLLSDANGGTFCASPGSLAVGEPCAAEQCVAGAQCLHLPSIASPPEGNGSSAPAVCARFCDPHSSFCGCQALDFSADVGVCTDPTRGASFSASFQAGIGSTQACNDWRAFKEPLSRQSFTRLTFSNDQGEAFVCDEPQIANQICNTLGQSSAFGSFSCAGHSWFVQDCGGGSDLFVDTTSCGCSFSGGSIRPCNGSQWGGLGNTCSFAQSQHMEVTCDTAPGFCGDGHIDPSSEECDGSALPPAAPFGSQCSASCTLVPPAGGCGQCAADACPFERAQVDAAGALAESVLDCTLGPDWRDGTGAPSSSCATVDASTCYCGSLSLQQCVVAPPETLTGQCSETILNATGCDSSACVSSAVFDPANPAGAALQYIQCEHEFCFDDCFSP